MLTEINNALNVIKEGGVILYPTDTIWGIGCDATNSDAVNKVYQIKKRTESKALISLVCSKEQLQSITNSTLDFETTIKPTTIIFPEITGLSPNLLANDGSAAIRIVKDEFCNKLISIFNKPIVSTSANISGVPSPIQFSEIADEIKKNVDYIVNLRQNEIMKTPSDILLVNTDESIKKIR